MLLDKALQAAHGLAANFDTKLGRCLFADDMGEGWWGFAFDMVGGPKNWCWLVMVNDAGKDMVMLAIHSRPAARLTPRIRRRWWPFGPWVFRGRRPLDFSGLLIS